MANNTVAILTGPGTAAIAVVRLAGPGVDDFLAAHFSKPTKTNYCVHGLLRDGDRVIDDIVAVRATDWVDLNLHGGNWVVQSAVKLAQSEGFELSSAIVTEGGSRLWDQVLAALPLARTEQAVRMLLAQPAAWETITNPRDLLQDTSGQWLTQLPRVAIVGPANVGKSTLANQLFGQQRCITADLPGTTRDWVGEIANLDGLAVMLLDTPGIRATDDPVEDAAIIGSATQIQSADLVVVVFDQSLPLDRAMLDRYPQGLRVANKSDAENAWNAAEIGAIQTVAVDGRGVGDLRSAIRRHFGWEPLVINQPRWWTDRQQAELRKLSGVRC